MIISDKYIEILIEMTEIHFQCFNKHYPEYNITYANVLELNHLKMINIFDGCLDSNEETLDYIFDSMKEDYERILNNDRPSDEDEYYGFE